MASEVDHCNGALSLIGAEGFVSAIRPPDGSVEAGYCATFFDQARRMLLESQTFAFSKRRAYLAETTNPSTVWAYAYAAPNLMLKALRILPLAQISTLALLSSPGTNILTWNIPDEIFTERGSSDFEMESAADGTRLILTNEPDAVLLYTADVPETTKWSPLFAQAFEMMLAGYVVGPIVKGEGSGRAGMQMREEAFKLAARAAGSNAASTSEPTDFVPDHLRARA